MISFLVGAFLAAAVLPDTLPSDSALLQRRRATEVSEWYSRRLLVHKIGAFAELPVFAAQYVVGQQLYRQAPGTESSFKDAHEALALTTGVLFTSNTITGLWNLWETRAQSSGRTRRIIHATLMLAADAGFLITAGLADDDAPGSGGARRHRQAAIASISVATVGAVMMWLWRD